MKRLIIVRHGNCNEDGYLDDNGRRQMDYISRRLKSKFTDNPRVVILTSTADRAKESAEILGKIFEVEIEPHEVLWSDRERRTDLSNLLYLVRSKKDIADVIILVTHLEYTEEFPYHFGKNELGVGHFPFRELGNGQFWDIDCEQKTILYGN